jgi:hypothetical protein
VGGAREHALFRVSFEFIQQLQPAIGLGVKQTIKPVIGVADLEVVEADIDAQGLEMLIGRDVLAYSALTYDGPMGTWTLEIPRTRPPGRFLTIDSPEADPSIKGASASRPVVRNREKVKAARKNTKKARKKNRGQ